MRAHRRAASAALLAAALAAPLAPPAHAAPERPRPHRVTAFVELVGVPAVDAATTARSDPREAARAARERTGNNADAVVDAVRSVDRGAARVGVTVNAVPGVVLTAEPAVLRWVAGMPQVRSVRQAVPKRVDNAGAVRLTGAADVWRAVGPSVPGHGVPGHGAGAVHGEGLRGEGLRIGVVDTGVDYTHADFGGAGGYDGVDRAGPWEPGAKVVGGYDFAGDDYDASDPEHGEPSPDPNPIDCQGHGTHVAGTAAGYGVGADGSTFTGAHSGLSDDDLAAMRIGPGTAPAAQVYALKVFGCSGSTNVVSQALDWALDPDGDGDPSDHLDVVNLSLGSDFGAVDDPDSAFVRKLVRHGVVVVASAGNAGDLYDSGGSPGSTPEAVTVANTRDASVLLDGVGLPGGSGEAEGKNNSAINIDKLSQLERNLQEDYQREEVTAFAKGVLFGNAYRFTRPQEREDFFTAKCLSGARRSGIALIRTPDLFNIAQYLKQNPNQVFAQQCRKAMVQAEGSIVQFPMLPTTDQQVK